MPARSRCSSSRATSSQGSGRGAASARCGRPPSPAAIGCTSSKSEVRGWGRGAGADGAALQAAGPAARHVPAAGTEGMRGRLSPSRPGGAVRTQVPQSCEGAGNGRRGRHLVPLGGAWAGKGQVTSGRL